MSKKTGNNFFKRRIIDFTGFGLIIISPFLGSLPGPGGIPIFLTGVAILARNYDWAENLLKDFDRRRIEFTKKYLMGNKKVSLAIDLTFVSTILVGILIILFAQSSTIKLISIGLITFSIFTILSNQNRLDRIINYLKLKHKQK